MAGHYDNMHLDDLHLLIWPGGGRAKAKFLV